VLLLLRLAPPHQQAHQQQRPSPAQLQDTQPLLLQLPLLARPRQAQAPATQPLLGLQQQKEARQQPPAARQQQQRQQVEGMEQCLVLRWLVVM